MIKLFFTLTFLATTLNALACDKKNHIFLIHGINGGRTTFGAMEKYLNKLDPCYQATSFVYDTGNSKLGTYDFAQHFHQFITERVKDGRITGHDKISLIMHSQGGIVGNLWLNYVKEADRALFSQIDSFITLSTPHWGADMARLGKLLFYYVPPSSENPLSPFGWTELNEMSYGSATIRDLAWNYEPLFTNNQVRTLALAGFKTGINLHSEGDIVVPIYSSRADHYVAVSPVSLSIKEEFIPAEIFTKTNKSSLVVVPASHIKMGSSPGIAEIPQSCLSDDSCDHPSVLPIVEHLKGRSIASVVPKLKNFRVNFYINNHSNTEVKSSDVKLNISKTGNAKISTLSYRGKAVLEKGKAFTMEGSLPKSGQQMIYVKLRVRNKASRLIEVPVEGGLATIVNLDLVD